MEKCKNLLFKVIKSQTFFVFALFLVISFLYYLCNVYNLFTIWDLSTPFIIGIFIIFLYLYFKKKLNKEKIILLIILLALALRITYAGYNNIFSRQHDVGLAYQDGHYGYAVYIFRNYSLPTINTSQFYQPPLNAILQAIWMHINTLFIPLNEEIKDVYSAIFNGEISFTYNDGLINYLNDLYNSCRILSCFYSCLTFLIIYKILKEFNLKDTTFYLILLLMATQPVLVMMSGTMNNDNLSFVFFFSALLFAIRWFKKQNYLNIILIALSIGLGMITKLSIGFIAIIIGPMMLIKYIQEFKEKKYFNLIPQFIVFALIVFPLGLSYAIRNYILFDQSFTYILDFGSDSWLHAVIKEKNIFERFFSLPISQLIHSERGIFHDYQEYNIWVDLIKTSIFEEFGYNAGGCIFGAIMFIINLGYWLILIPVIIYILYKIKKKTYQGNLPLTIICLSLIILALISYVSLCVKMPYSCTSNFRYIAYISFAMASIYCLALENINNLEIKKIVYILLGIFVISTSFFILVI